MKKIFLFNLLLAIAILKANAQVPVLNSYPSASPTLFLDFDGQTLDATAWNYNGPIVCGGSGLTAAQIQDIFTRVAEDFRPFNINVTTDSLKFWAAPVLSRQRVIITVTYGWYGSNAGGVSYVGTFSGGDDTPCFIFSQLLGFNIKQISEAVSHESGHTLGLYHQSRYDANCVKISDYHTGTGSGETGWAPIMGVGYYQNLTVWHNGPNSYGCNVVQNDLNVIASTQNGITLRTDDIGNTSPTAKNITIANNQFSASGIIESTNDNDLFKVVLGTSSRFIIHAVPSNAGNPNVGANIDIMTELLNNSLTVIKTRNPTDSLQASIDTLLNAGTYYLRIKPVANTYASTYGMLGQYSVSGNIVPAGVLPLRKIELTGKASSGYHELKWLVDADEEIEKVSLEYSVSGGQFIPLTNLGGAAGTYSYIPSATGKVMYRLRVSFIHGPVYYSAIISLGGDDRGQDMPLVLSNPAVGSTVKVKGSSNDTYVIYDINGRMISKGRLNDGITDIYMTRNSPGMYIIKFTDNLGHASSQKIVVQ